MRIFVALAAAFIAFPVYAQSVGEIVGWKTGHHPGITSRDDRIVEWPNDAPFVRPDDATLNQWRAEYLAAKPDVEAQRELNDMKVIRALVRWLAPLVGKTPQEARNEIIAIYKSL